MTKRAAFKARVSSRGQKDDGTSLDTQEERIREYATNAGYKIVESLTVSDVHSGTEVDCAGMTRLRQAAEQGLIDVLIFHSYDRLIRPENEGDEWQVLGLVAFFRDHGVTIEFVEGSIPTEGLLGALSMLLEGGKSGDYRRKLIEATHRGTVAAVKAGKFTSSPPYGYCIDEDGFLAIDEEQAKIVRMVFDLYDRERLGVRKIQLRLSGVFDAPSRSQKEEPSKRWHQSMIHRIFNREYYWSGRHPLGETMGIVDGVPCPPIIAPEQAKRVLDRLHANKRIKKSPRSKTLLQGRIQCCCKGNWKFQSARKGKTKAEYYCQNRYSDGPGVENGGDKCDVPRRGQNELELTVAIALINALKSPENLSAALQVSLRNAEQHFETYGAEIEPLNDSIKEVEDRLQVAYRARLNGVLTDAELDTKEKMLNENKAELQRRLDDLDPDRLAQLEEAREMLSTIDYLLDWANSYGSEMPITGMKGLVSFTPTAEVGTESLSANDVLNGIGSDSNEDVLQDVAQMLALFSPEWWISEPERFESDDWIVNVLTEVLDRLHAKITMHHDHAVLEGVLQLTIPFGSKSAPTNSLHASHKGRGLG
jgi:site-specific DNA recombinase